MNKLGIYMSSKNSVLLAKIVSRVKYVLLALVSNLFQLLLGKLIAYIDGPSGTIVFNNLKHLIQIFSAFFTLNSENLVTIQIAKEGLNVKNIYQIFNRYKINAIVASVVILLLLNIKNKYIPVILSSGINMQLFFISSILFALNIFAFAVLNGIDKLDIAYINQIIGMIFSLIVLIVSIALEFQGNQSIVNYFFILTAITFIFNILVLRKSSNYKQILYLESVEMEKTNNFSAISVILIFSVYLIGNGLQFIVRNKFVEFYSIKSAGLIDSAFTLSNYFTTLVVSLFTVNALSSLSKISDYNKIRKLSIRILVIGFVVLLCTNTVLFIVKDYLLKLFYTEEFIVINELYGYLIMGDIFKILAISLMVVALAYGSVITYALLGLLGNSITSIPFILHKFYSYNELGCFYVLSNSLFFLLSIFIFYYEFKPKYSIG